MCLKTGVSVSAVHILRICFLRCLRLVLVSFSLSRQRVSGLFSPHPRESLLISDQKSSRVAVHRLSHIPIDYPLEFVSLSVGCCVLKMSDLSGKKVRC